MRRPKNTVRSAPSGVVTAMFTDIVDSTKLKALMNGATSASRDAEFFANLKEPHDKLVLACVEAAGGHIVNPTGDGYCFTFTDAEEAVLCAIEIQEQLLATPIATPLGSLQIRVGLHTGYARATRGDYVASTLDKAARVQSKAEPCGVLVSGETHALVSGKLHGVRFEKAGPFELKGLEAEVLYRALRTESRTGRDRHKSAEHAGTPSRVKIAVTSPTHAEPPPTQRLFQKGSDPGSSLGGQTPFGTASQRASVPETFVGFPMVTPARISLLYKRFAQPDEHLLQMLEKGFKARGHHVFVDRHMAIGVEWAKELEGQLRASDAVLLLLSAASIQSEMLAMEVRIVHDEAQKRGGKPLLLPVRINFEGRLPPELAGFLDRLQYFLWQGPQDNERLVKELLNALLNPPPLRRIPPPSGVVPLESKHYVVRPTDQEFQTALARRDSVILIRGARQMGKTSLLARGLHEARSAGMHIVMTDFQKLNSSDLESLETFYLTLGRWLADELNLSVYPEDVWNKRRGPSVNFERFVLREVLEKIPVPLVWAMDEVDRLFPCAFASEVFGLFRSWHNARTLQPHLAWSRLTLAIAYATEAHLFISDLNQSPFNVGTLVSLEDFTLPQVAELNRLYGSPLRTDQDLLQFFELLNGQPYLVNRGLYEIVQHQWDLAAFTAQADSDEGVFGDHLRRLLVLIARNPELCDVVQQVLRGQPCPTPESFYRLRSSGVVAGDSAREGRPRCRLYANYLERHLL